MIAAKTPAKKAASAKAKGGDGYTVVAPLIQVQVGSQLLQFLFGDVLPDGLSSETVDHLTDNGLIQKGEAVAEPESPSGDE